MKFLAFLYKHRYWLALLLGLAAAVVLYFITAKPHWHDSLQPTVLWAQERPEDLRFLDPTQIAVAFLAGTLRLSADKVKVHVLPRRQPLRIPPTTRLIAVVRIETLRQPPPNLSDKQRHAVIVFFQESQLASHSDKVVYLSL